MAAPARPQWERGILPLVVFTVRCIAATSVPAAGAGPASALDGVPADLEPRAAMVQRWVEELEPSPLQLPIHVESEQTGDRLRGNVHSIVERGFDAARKALTLPASWCEILPLQFNVKACTHGQNGRDRLLTLYVGRKFYQKPEAAYRLQLLFEVVREDESACEIALRGDEGPLGTRDYVFAAVAVPVARERTLIDLSYGYRYGLVSQVAMFGYLKTLGRNKVGFTVVGTDSENRPIHVKGVQGVIERNAMRYHLAVQAYLDTLDVPAPQRFERRIERWFDLTSAYPKQLFEMERDEYLGYKRRERTEQLRLQKAASAPAGHTVAQTPAAANP